MLLCKVLSVTRSGYYAWCSRQPSAHAREDERLLRAITTIYQGSGGRYGSPRIHRALANSGIRCSRKRVARLMRSHAIRARATTSRRRACGASDEAIASANLIERDFRASRCNQRWLSDTTQIATAAGTLYLAAVLDVYSRRIVGWSIGSSEHEGLVTAAVTMAFAQRRPPAGLILHSDRGRAYCARGYRALLCARGVRQSMSAAGNCYDNAMMESFFATLKRELVKGQRFAHQQQARTAIVEYIEIFYNQQRLHSALGYRTPAEFEMASPVSTGCPL